MGSGFPEYDAENDVIRLNGAAGAMLGILTHAKFGEPFAELTTFHPQLSKLMSDLASANGGDSDAAGLWPDWFTSGFAAAIARLPSYHGWSSMNEAEKIAFVQMAAVPHQLSSTELSKIVNLADGAEVE